jgi:hypothetical protein
MKTLTYPARNIAQSVATAPQLLGRQLEDVVGSNERKLMAVAETRTVRFS